MAERPAFAAAADMARPRCTAGVISDARGRQRRRLVAIALAGTAVAAGAGVTVARTETAPSAPAAARAANRVAPSAVLSRAPYMGIASHTHRPRRWV
jgi:hypothetical protein